jgi:hypothetical protein
MVPGKAGVSIIQPMRLVIVESPYRATAYRTVIQHREYLRLAMADCIRRGESPMASHHLYPEILDDDTPYERVLGIRAGLAWGIHADAVCVYSQLGVSPGMAQAIQFYKGADKPIEWRGIDPRQVRRILEM